MPGVATIELTWIPIAQYTTDQLRKLEIEFDKLFTRDLERDWEGMVSTDNPKWDDLITMLDSCVATTKVGPYGVGDVKGDPKELPITAWDWNRTLHEYGRSLLLNDKGKYKKFTFTADSNKLEAVVKATYRWRNARVLK